MIRLFILLSFLPVLGCEGDESLSGYAQTDNAFVLVELNDVVFEGRATLVLASGGDVRGEAPCNTWSAIQSAPYPWFELGPIAATRRACADLSMEQAFFAALGDMTISEVSGDILILSNTDGGRMVFQAE